MGPKIGKFDQVVRYTIFHFFAENCRAPSVQELSCLLKVDDKDVSNSIHRLHQSHLIFLEPGADMVRIANPFSAVPTRYRVRSGEKEWWANCAWDSLGIAAAMQIDAEILARYADSEETVMLQVRNGSVDGMGHVVYFPLPFLRWYDDLVFT